MAKKKPEPEKPEPKKRQGAAERLRVQGKSMVWVAPDAEQKQQIRMAAAACGLPMSKFLLAAGLAEAERILAKLNEK